MIEVDIPGYGRLKLRHLVLDHNGTLARDGRLLAGVRPRLIRLSKRLSLHVLTADTFGRARSSLRGIPCRLLILSEHAQDKAKLAYVRTLGAAGAACIGNGRNDRRMLRAAALGIAVVQAEGVAVEALSAADIISPDITAALELLLHPKRLIATLRS